MQKKSMKQRVFAVALATAFAFSPAFPSFTAYAASETMEETSETKGAVTDEKISLKDSYAQGQVTTEWTFNYSNDALKPVPIKTAKVPDGYYWDYEGGKWVFKLDNTTHDEDYNYSFNYPVYSWNSQWDSATNKNVYSVVEGTITEYGIWDPELKILIFDSGDRTKPDGGDMHKDENGKYVIDWAYHTYSYEDPKYHSNPKYEFDVYASELNPGKKDVVGYILNEPAYREALLKAKGADDKAYNQAYVAWQEAMDKWNADKTGTKPEEPDQADYTTNSKAVSEADYYIKTNAVGIEVLMAANIDAVVKSTSVELSLSASGATGYEIYRKAGKKYIKIATVSSAKYLDKGLTANTTYAYKVRPYYVDRYTGKTSYGKYTTKEVTTTGSALNVKATVTSKNKVKLTWKKVTGATKYQIYKVDTSSMTTTVANANNNPDYNSFSASKLIATVKKNKKTYTDKDVLTNRSYSYMVRAVLPKNGKKSRYIDSWASVSIEFGELTNVQVAKDATGNKTVKWNQVYGATGYLVEKYVSVYKEDKAYYNDYELKYNPSTGIISYTNGDNEDINRYKITGDKVYKFNGYGTTLNSVPSYKKIGNVLYEYDADEDSVGEAVYAISGTAVYDANTDGSIHYVEDYDLSDWKEYKKLGKTSTSVKLPAVKEKDKNNKLVTTTEYRIRAYKGTTYGASFEVDTTYSGGVVAKVTATKAANGIKVTWSKVAGAAYYEVYRVPTDVLVKNNDIGAYESDNGSRVTEYVGVKTPVKVDVAAWNKTVDDSIAKFKAARAVEDAAYEKAEQEYYDGKRSEYPQYDDFHKIDSNDYFHKDDRLNEKIEYYYQNYSYSRNIFTDADAANGIIDYCGDIYTGSTDIDWIYYDNNRKELATPFIQYSIDPVVAADNVKKSGCKSGVSYTYYVVAYLGTPKTGADYKKDRNGKYADSFYTESEEYVPAYNMSVTGPQLPVKSYYGPYIWDYGIYKYVKYATKGRSLSEDNFKDVYAYTVGCKTVGTATFTETKAPGKPTLKSVKASKGKVTIAIKKKVKDADYYKVYRSTKKKGAYSSVGVTSNAKTLKFTDTSAKKGTKYFYKVVAVKKNEANGEVESKASAIKSVKAK